MRTNTSDLVRQMNIVSEEHEQVLRELKNMQYVVGYISDILEAYNIVSGRVDELQEEEGKSVPELEFIYKYDMQSFFNYFSFLNVTKVAELAGINASLMRQYTSGVTAAGQKQYDKIRVAVERISKELSAATF
jgi:hypothetical protein